MLTYQILELRGQSGTYNVPFDDDGNVPHDWPSNIHQARATMLAHRQPIPPGTVVYCDGLGHLDAHGVVLRDQGEAGIEVWVENDLDGTLIRERCWTSVEDLHGASPKGRAELLAALTPARRADLGLPTA